MKKFTTIIVLCILFCSAVWLRWHLLPSHLFFGPEQGRDMLVIRDIVVNHKLTLIGSKTDISGIFHGPIFYYLSAIPFAVTKGNPLAVSFFMILIQSIGVLFMYLLGRDITKSKRVGLIAAVFYTISFLGVVYGRWLSNPPLSIPLSLIGVWSMLRFLQGEKRYIFLTAISFACLGQAEFINFLLFAGIVCVVVIRFWKRIRVTPVSFIGLGLMVGLAVSLGNYVLFDIRHEFLISKSVLGLMSGASGYGTTLFDSMKSASLMFASQFAMTFGIVSWKIGASCMAITLCVLLIERKRHEYVDLVIMWLLVPLLILMGLRHSVLEQLYVGLVPGMILAAAIVVEFFIKKVRIAGIGLGMCVIVMNVYAYTQYLPTNSHVFFQSPQPNVRYQDQLKVVDGIYRLANGKDFFFQSYTIPYFWQDAWTYLFWYQGTRRYGYVPKEEETSVVYVIMQKEQSDPAYQANWYEKTVTTWGKRTEGFTIGEYTVEIRQRER
ncbi:MAG: glycosyltransferase family 39 protein [Candidatus Gottesmanbacteria bacterium]